MTNSIQWATRLVASLLVGYLCGVSPTTSVAHADPVVGAFQAVTDEAVAAANAFLATLNDTQRTAVVFAFDDGRQRQNWSNLPSPMVKRSGLRLGDLKPEQLAAAHKVLKTLLSAKGYEKVVGIMNGDEVLKREGGPGGLVFGNEEYFISFVGKPSSTDPWMLQWGGHHLALNVTVHGPHGVLTPSHTATQPSKFTWEGKTVRPLGAEYDKAFALMSALTDEQRKKAVIGSQMADLVLGPGRDGKTIQPEGLKASEMTSAQRESLLDLTSEWVGIQSDAAASAKMDELKSNLAETWFAWSGPTTPGSAAYYRIQGPTVVIEFSPQRLGGNPLNHIHTMFRDPSNDYGRKWWKN